MLREVHLLTKAMILGCMSGSPPVRVIWETPRSASLSIASSAFSLATNTLGVCFQMAQKVHLAMHTLVTANSAKRKEPVRNVLSMCLCFGFIESSLGTPGFPFLFPIVQDRNNAYIGNGKFR